MDELLAPPDVEPALVEVLSRPGGPWVATRYPSDPAAEVAGVIRVSATGGGRPIDRFVVAPTLLVECWHSDEGEAIKIANEAWARLRSASGTIAAGVDLKHVASTLPVNNPDTARPRLVRYQFIVEVWTRLVPLEVTP